MASNLLRPGALVAAALLLASCGASVPVRLGPAGAGGDAGASGVPGVLGLSAAKTVAGSTRTRSAWVRLRQETYLVRPGQRVRLWPEFVDSTKPVESWVATWTASRGRFDRRWTYSPAGANTWTAPDSPSGYRVDVSLEIRYMDGTWEEAPLSEIIWVRSGQ